MREDIEEFGGRIRDETGRKDLRKLVWAEIGEPMRDDKKDEKVEDGAAR
jgi:hypothetical protein